MFGETLGAAQRAAPAAPSGARNARCGCGSGRARKRCCGALPPWRQAEADVGPEVAGLLAAALRAQVAGQFARARELYERVLDESPAMPDALHMLGVVFLQTGDYARALTAIRDAAEAFDWRIPAVRHNLRLTIAAILTGAGAVAAPEAWLAYREALDAGRTRRRSFAGTISVVVPAYNHARWIDAALASLREQTRAPDEVVVIDDGSGDATPRRIAEALASLPGRTRFVSRPNRGAAATINEAVRMSTGDYVNVLNSDDLFTAARLADMADAVAAVGAEWGFSRVACIDADGFPLARGQSVLADALEDLVDDVMACDSVSLAFLGANAAVSSGSLFFSRSLFDRLGGFPDLAFNHDWGFALRASLEAEPVFVPDAHYRYRLHGTNTILGGGTRAAAEVAALFRSFHEAARATLAPAQPFAPVPAVWGPRYYLRLLHGGQADLLAPEVLRDCAAVAERALREGFS